jgi:hypothetical protein
MDRLLVVCCFLQPHSANSSMDEAVPLQLFASTGVLLYRSSVPVLASVVVALVHNSKVTILDSATKQQVLPLYKNMQGATSIFARTAPRHRSSLLRCPDAT